MTAVQRTTRDRVLDILLGAAFPLSGLGLAALVAGLALGFEEANRTMLAVSLSLLLSAPLAVLIHVVLTRDMTREERRRWLHALAGPGAISAFSRYAASRQRRGFPSASIGKGGAS